MVNRRPRFLKFIFLLLFLGNGLLHKQAKSKLSRWG